MEENDDVPIN